MTHARRPAMLLAALLALAACDSGGPDAVTRLSQTAFEVEAPRSLRFGEVHTVRVTLSNTTGSDLYLGRPEIQLYLQPEAPFTTGERAAVPLVLAYVPFTPAVLSTPVRIQAGGSAELHLELDLRGDGLALWTSPPADGQYVIGATLYTTPGDFESLYRGAPASDGVSFSAPLELSFVR